MGDHRGNASKNVKDQKAEMAEIILDIVPESPEKGHVTEKVQPAAMQEHGREYGRKSPIGLAKNWLGMNAQWRTKASPLLSSTRKTNTFTMMRKYVVIGVVPCSLLSVPIGKAM